MCFRSKFKVQCSGFKVIRSDWRTSNGANLSRQAPRRKIAPKRIEEGEKLVLFPAISAHAGPGMKPDPSAQPQRTVASSSGAESRAERTQSKSPQIPDYELVRCIGRGSYGDVWLARNVLG